MREHSADPVDAMKNEGGFITRLPRDAAACYALADRIAKSITEDVNVCRLAEGLPPLKKTDRSRS